MPSAARNPLFLPARHSPLATRHFPQPNNPLLPRNFPRRGQLPRLSNPHPPDSSLVKNHANPCGLSPLHHPPRGKNLGQRLARRQVHPAFPFWRLFPRGSWKRLRVLAFLNSFIINTYKPAPQVLIL